MEAVPVLVPQDSTRPETQMAVDELRSRFLRKGDGVVIRLWECTLGLCLGHAVKPNNVDPAANPRKFLEECSAREHARASRPASVLRWDLPAALFVNGRCTDPATIGVDRRVDSPVQRIVNHDGYVTTGFTGHNVTGAGVGMIFGPLKRRRRIAAFGHDAWTFTHKKSGTNRKAAMPACPSRRPSSAYADARWAARSAPTAFERGSPQHVAAAYKWGFANTSWNCYHKDWERAFDDQRAFALRLAAAGEATLGGGGRAECSIWGSLYNQVHITWNGSDVRALFYVNDTHTATTAGARAVRRLLADARAASERAYASALFAQRTLAPILGRTLPIVQYRPDSDCYDGRGVARRVREVQQAGGGGAAAKSPAALEAAANAFAMPPWRAPALASGSVEYFK